MTTLRIRFEGLTPDYTAKQWRIPELDYITEPFEPIPADATSILVPRARSVFVNRPGDRRRQDISFEEAKAWGFDHQDDTDLIYAQAKSTSTRFCLRLLLNAELSTRDTRSNTFQTYARLVKDAKFHAAHLINVEGLLVPFHYGMWIMDTGDWAGKVLFSITQWCGMSWHELSRTKMNTEANRILVGRTFEAVHDYGVDHGGLGYASDFRHVILDAHGLSRADALNGKARCYIVGFSEALANHKCTRKLPILPLDTFLHEKDVGCDEITDVLILIKFMKSAHITTPASKALEWHAKYSEIHPDIQNVHVLMAQRARLYGEMPPVYPELHVEFESDDLYAKVIIMRDRTDSDDQEMAPTEDDVDGSRADYAAPETVVDSLETAVDKLQLTKLDDTGVAC
ncbi:hypothetical protein C8R44DRAFT_754297 [Mycena epipterygia]|nr:hypothetical protein C8R44DRAFT_754297 [Mycena epipterygia]